MRGLSAATAFVALGILAACTPGHADAAKDVVPAPGQCVAKEKSDLDGFAPDFTSVVPCTSAHVYEIVDALNVPKKFLAGGSRAKRLERRTELDKSTASSSLANEFHTYANRACRRSVLKATGLDAVNVNGLSALDAGVRPVLLGANTLTGVSAPDQWAAGRHLIVCSMRYTEPVAPGLLGRLSAIRSSSSIPTYRSLLSKRYPAELRACGSYDSDNYLYAVLCSNQHNVELLFSYDAQAAFGKDLIKNINSLNPTDSEWDLLSTPCTVMLQNVVGTDVDDDLDGSVYLADDWGRSGSGHKAYCLITPDSDHQDLPPGSVVGRAGDITEVPAKKGKQLIGGQSAT